MKRYIIAAALLAGATAVSAQQSPASVPPPTCEKPRVPGQTLMQETSIRKRFERDVKEYEACMKSYLEERKAAMKAQETAANDAVNDYNATIKGLNEAQKAR